MSLGAFVAGFASGWVVRSTIDSSRGVAVGAVSAAYSVVDRAKRLVAMEREHLEDLVAEGRAKFEERRARATARKAPRSTSARAETAEPGRGHAA